MTTLQKLRHAKHQIDNLIKTLEEANQEIDEQVKIYKRHNTELPRKSVARMIGCTENYVSRLKAQGRLRSYRYADVMHYIKTH